MIDFLILRERRIGKTPPHTHTHTQRKDKNKSRKAFHCGSSSMLQCVLESIPLSTHLYLQMLTVMSHWAVLRPLASATPSIPDPHWDSSQMSCCCPCHGAPAALALQDWSFHLLQQIIDGIVVGVRQLKSLDQEL